MDIKEKAESLTNRINSITSTFSEQLDNANALIIAGDELSTEANEIVQEVIEPQDKQYTFNLDLIPQILNLETMVSDIKYIRGTLQENCDLGKRLLKVMSDELTFEPNAELLASYSELSKTITENMKLYLACYKDVSTILINISKLTQQQQTKNVVNNNITIETQAKVQNTADLIKQLAELSKQII